MELHAMDDGKLLLISLIFLTLIVAMVGRIDIFRLVEDTLCSPAGGYLQQIFGSVCSVL